MPKAGIDVAFSSGGAARDGSLERIIVRETMLDVGLESRARFLETPKDDPPTW